MHAERRGEGSSFTLMWLVRWWEAIILIKTEKTPRWHLQPPPPSIYLTSLSRTYQSLPLSVCSVCVHLPQSAGSFHSIIHLSSTDWFSSLSCFLSSTFSLLSSSPPIHLYDTGYFSPSLLHSFRLIPFSCGWWGPEKAGSVSSHDPRQQPPSPARRIPQSPSSPVNEMMKAQPKGIRSHIMRLYSEMREMEGFSRLKKKKPDDVIFQSVYKQHLLQQTGNCLKFFTEVNPTNLKDSNSI